MHHRACLVLQQRFGSLLNTLNTELDMIKKSLIGLQNFNITHPKEEKEADWTIH
jgi:hypothetical protein